MVKFGKVLEQRSREIAAHIPPDEFVDYATLNGLVAEALEHVDVSAASNGDASTNGHGGCWEASFHELYLLQVEKVKAYLRTQLAAQGTDNAVPASVLRDYVELNEKALDKISKKFDKARAFLSVRRKLTRRNNSSEHLGEFKLRRSGSSSEHLKHPATTLVLATGYLRSDNAQLFEAEIVPLQRELFAGGNGSVHGDEAAREPVHYIKAALVASALAAGCLYAVYQHASHLDDAFVVLPWHAGLVLALGWPMVLVGWLAGHKRVAPRGWIEFIAAVAACIVTSIALAGAEPPPYPASVGAWVWWMCLTGVSVANVRLLMGLYNRVHQLHARGEMVSSYQTKLLRCTAAYVSGCFVRSVFPRVDVERICFFDHILSVTFVGRALATVAEIGFAMQLAMVLGRLTDDLRHPSVRRMNPSPCPEAMLTLSSGVSRVIVPLIAIAQTCCWCGVTTTRQLWHAIEESIWAVTIALMVPCLANVAHQCAAIQSHPNVLEEEEAANFTTSADDSAEVTSANSTIVTRSFRRAPTAPFACKPTFAVADGLSRGKRFGLAGAFLGPLFVAFMIMVDIPMYVHRWREDEAQGTEYLSFKEGLFDTMRCRQFSRNWTSWSEEIPWMSMYFSGCVWMSVWMGWAAPTLVLDGHEEESEGRKNKKD